MKPLSEETCQNCSKANSPLSEHEQISYLKRIDQWDIISIKGVQQLTKIFSFKNFADAIAFTNAVGELAEAENHHPTLVTEWGSVRVTWWTHSIGGLHANDFILAARSDEIQS